MKKYIVFVIFISIGTSSFANEDLIKAINKGIEFNNLEVIDNLNGTLKVATTSLIDNKKNNIATNLINDRPNFDIQIKKVEILSSNNSSESNNKLINLSNIINTAIGAILGLGIALYIDYHLIRRKRQKSIENIILELKDIRNTLKELKDNTDIPSIFGYAFSVPIWETVIGNGDILELKNKPYYNFLFIVYSHITKLKKMEDWFYENHFIMDTKNCNVYMTEIISQRNEVYSWLSTSNILTSLF